MTAVRLSRTACIVALCASACGGCGRVSLDLGEPARDGGDAGGGGIGIGVSDAGDVTCVIGSVVWRVVPPEILVVLDRSFAGSAAAWTGMVTQLAGVVADHDLLFDWALYTFPDDGPACATAARSAVDVPFVPLNAAAVATAIAATTPEGNGTPTAAAILAATSYLRALPERNAKFILLASDGAASCPGDAISAVAAAHGEGFGTIVVGLAPATPADVSALNALAAAGGYAPQQADVKFYAPSNIGELFTPTDTFSCVVNLFPAPAPAPDPDAVTIKINGDVIPRDRAHIEGWDYVDQQQHIIQLYGWSCERLHWTRSGTVEAYAACPG